MHQAFCTKADAIDINGRFNARSCYAMENQQFAYLYWQAGSLLTRIAELCRYSSRENGNQLSVMLGEFIRLPEKVLRRNRRNTVLQLRTSHDAVWI